MLDLDTTIAHDEPEQIEEMPSSTPLSSSVDPLFIPDDSSEVLGTPASESDPVTPISCQSPDSNTIGEGDNLECGPTSTQPFESSFADTKVKEVTDLFFGTEELGLDKLFKETVHVHAQKPQVSWRSLKSQGEPKIKGKDNPPVETVSRTGRRRKIPSYLQDYQC